MVHVGKYGPLFMWRDMCGPFTQGGAFCPYKYLRIRGLGGEGYLEDWVMEHKPFSGLCVRIDEWEQALSWKWTLPEPAGPPTTIFVDWFWEDGGAGVSVHIQVDWTDGHAEAHRVLDHAIGLQFPEQIEKWDDGSTTDPAVIQFYFTPTVKKLHWDFARWTELVHGVPPEE